MFFFVIFILKLEVHEGCLRDSRDRSEGGEVTEESDEEGRALGE